MKLQHVTAKNRGDMVTEKIHLCQALAEKISQTTGHLGEAKDFCAKAGLENGRWPNLGFCR